MYCISFPDKKQFKKIGDAKEAARKLTLSQKEEVAYYYCKSCFKYHIGRTGFITNSTYKRSLKPKPAIKVIGKIELPSPKTNHEKVVVARAAIEKTVIEKKPIEKNPKCLCRGIGIQNIKQNSNKMNVKLVSITKSLIEEKELSPEELIVYVARVSNPSNQLNSETADKLIAYMIKNKHWYPFEMCDMTVEIVTSRGIAQQILRHRSFSFQEFSQRYAEVTEFEPIQLRKAGTTNRQSSSEVFDPIINGNMEASRLIKAHIKEGEDLYSDLLKVGVAKECARFVLPITTQTKIYMKGSIRSWIHYLQIRCDSHTQLEHQQIALAIQDIFKAQFPNIYKVLNPSPPKEELTMPYYPLHKCVYSKSVTQEFPRKCIYCGIIQNNLKHE